MKKIYFLILFLALVLPKQNLFSQLIQIDNNHSLSGFPFNGKIIFVSDMDSTFYISDGASVATQLSTVKIDSDEGAAILNNKLYFSGRLPATGSELWVTDATSTETKIIADLVSGPGSSNPSDFIVYNNKLYFTAATPANGRELYEYTGSGSPTKLADINPGVENSFDDPALFINNGILYFDAINATGNAIYTLQASTVTKILDIPPGYELGEFTKLGTTVFFSLSAPSSGFTLYKTNGTPGSTVPLHTFTSMLGETFYNAVEFKNKLLFVAAESGFDLELWMTDGTTTQMLKDINPGENGSFPLLINSVILNGRLFFMATTDDDGAELWSTDGTTTGTEQFMNINPIDGEGSDPFLFPVFSTDFTGSGTNFGFYKRDKTFNGYIFFSADNGTDGIELWKTNGTSVGTSMVKDINPSGDGITENYLYTTTGLIFSGDDGVNGTQPWISDGTRGGTVPIVNINTAGDSDPSFEFIWNGHVYLTATDGDDPLNTDYYRLGGTYTSLPIQLGYFTATANKNSVQLDWSTASESNGDHFEVERSKDGNTFTSVGSVVAAGNSSTEKKYLFDDITAYQQGVTLLYYRLRSYDKDGKSVISNIIPVRLDVAPNQFSLYPNPVTDQLQVRYSAPNNTSQLQILDLGGRQVYKAALPKAENGMYKVDFSGFKAGVYILKFTSGASTQTQKIIKK